MPSKRMKQKLAAQAEREELAKHTETTPEEAVATALEQAQDPDIEAAAVEDDELGTDVSDIIADDDDQILADPDDGFEEAAFTQAVDAAAERPTDATADLLENSESEERIAMQLERMTRDEESRGATDYYEVSEFSDQAEFNLTAPEPRPGMDQRWIAAQVMGGDQPTNLAKSHRRGWRPRDPHTVKERNFPTYEGANGKGYIGQAGLVLMERPMEITERRRDHIRRITEAREHNSARRLVDDAVPGNEIRVDHHSTTTQGRHASPRVAEE